MTIALLRVWMIVVFESNSLMLWVNVFKDGLTWIFYMSTELTVHFIFIIILPMALKNIVRFGTPCTDRARLIMYFVNKISHFLNWIKCKVTVSFLCLDPNIGIFKLYFDIFCCSMGSLSLMLGILSFTYDFFSLL